VRIDHPRYDRRPPGVDNASVSAELWSLVFVPQPRDPAIPHEDGPVHLKIGRCSIGDGGTHEQGIHGHS
jgi:hypothetical protein